MKRIKLTSILVIILFASLSSVLAKTAAETKQKPNIIFVITDDQGMIWVVPVIRI